MDKFDAWEIINMLEVYLFINPISEACYQTEKEIINLLNESKYKVRFRVLPLLTLATVKFAMENAGLPGAMRNKVVDTLYRASLDYEAALFQGQKLGRAFLLNAQKATIKNGFKYTNEIARTVASNSGLDLQIFEEDRHSKLAAKTFRKDQHLAAEMDISTYPTVIVTNSEYPEYGFSLNPQNSFDLLEQFVLHPNEFINTPYEHCQYLHSAKLKE